MDVPTLIKGGLAIDDRGIVVFVNEFLFHDVKRFYQVENFTNDVIRAFHGHRKEKKYVYVPMGSALVITIPIDELIERKRKEYTIYRYVLSSKNPSILYIPNNYANGFKDLEGNTKILFFSTSTLDESKDDDLRFPYDIAGTQIWETDNR